MLFLQVIIKDEAQAYDDDGSHQAHECRLWKILSDEGSQQDSEDSPRERALQDMPVGAPLIVGDGENVGDKHHGEHIAHCCLRVNEKHEDGDDRHVDKPDAGALETHEKTIQPKTDELNQNKKKKSTFHFLPLSCILHLPIV